MMEAQQFEDIYNSDIKKTRERALKALEQAKLPYRPLTAFSFNLNEKLTGEF